MGYFRRNIEKAKGYTPGFQPSAIDVTKLNTNENPYPPSPQVARALSTITTQQLRRYPDPLGNSFRNAAAEVNDVDPDFIMCTNGGDDLLTIAFRAFCDLDRPVAYPVPSYSLYPVLAQLQDCRTIEVDFDNEFNLPTELIKTGAALTIICNPNAPSTTFIDPAELASLADELSGILLIDEAYVDFADDNCARLTKELDNVIILRSMSKGYSLAGIRFGYAIANPDLISELMKVKDSYNVDALAITAATAAIRDQAYFKDSIEKIKAGRRTLTDKLRALKFNVADSSSNFVLAECKDLSASGIYKKLAERNIFIRYFPTPGLDDKLRVTVGTTDQNDKLISALKEILSK